MAKKDDEQIEQPKAKKGTLALILAVVLGVILLAGVGAGAYFLGSRNQPAPEAAADGKDAKSGDKAAEVENKVGPMVDISSFIINILDRDEVRYLKASLSLEADNEETAKELDERRAQVRDAILLLIGNKTFDELRDLQGKMQLRAELMAQVNTLLQKGQVKNIYFTDFVVQ